MSSHAFKSLLWYLKSVLWSCWFSAGTGFQVWLSNSLCYNFLVKLSWEVQDIYNLNYGGAYSATSFCILAIWYSLIYSSRFFHREVFCGFHALASVAVDSEVCARPNSPFVRFESSMDQHAVRRTGNLPLSTFPYFAFLSMFWRFQTKKRLSMCSASSPSSVAPLSRVPELPVEPPRLMRKRISLALGPCSR